jgi:hypothetical protein
MPSERGHMSVKRGRSCLPYVPQFSQQKEPFFAAKVPQATGKGAFSAKNG